MYLVYVDDYGHTGADLANPQQPIYMLFAILVPEDNWAIVEASLWGIITEIADKTGQDLAGFELHAKDFFNGRNRVYRALSFEEKLEYLARIIKLVVAFQCKCIAVHVIKQAVQQVREEAAAQKVEGEQGVSNLILSAFLPHPLVFSELLNEIDNFCKIANQNAVVILDHQEEYAQSRQLISHSLYRHQTEDTETRILDMPLDGDGRFNILLQISDLLGWAFGRQLKTAHLGHKASPELAEVIAPLLPIVTTINALETFSGGPERPLARSLFAEYSLRTDKSISGNTRIQFLTDMLIEAAETKKKGKEHSNE